MNQSMGYVGSLGSLAILLLLAIVGLPIFAIQFHRNGRQPSERLRRLGSTPLLGMWIMEYGYWLVRLPMRAARLVGASPDVVTLLGLAMTLGASVCLGLGWFALGGWVFLVGLMLDAVDGMLAREMKRVSIAGEFLDAMVDRYADFAVLAGLTFYYRDSVWAMGIVQGALLGSIMVSYARAKAEALEIHDAPGWLMRRHERGVYIGFGVALSPVMAGLVEPHVAHPVYHVALAACALVAVLSNIAAVRLFVDVRQRLIDRENAKAAAAGARRETGKAA
jgi:phosphatidylglycerophosphate synthase